MEIAKYIDHTLLKADARKEEIIQLCEEARQYGFKSVCINPTWIATACELLAGTEVEVCTVIGFPLGANTTSVKVFEAQEAVKLGATEIDMVINIGAAKDHAWEMIKEEIQAVVAAVDETIVVKVIIETALLSNEEIQELSRIVSQSGADFVKTSTGFSSRGASLEDVTLMRQAVGPTFDIKASGGVRNLSQAREMIAAGATRIGASKGVEIVIESLE